MNKLSNSSKLTDYEIRKNLPYQELTGLKLQALQLERKIANKLHRESGAYASSAKLDISPDLKLIYECKLPQQTRDDEMSIFKMNATKLPINDPLHKILEEENQVVLNSLPCHDDGTNGMISRQEIRTLSMFESPPPELWIVARVLFLLTSLYFYESKSEAASMNSQEQQLNSNFYHNEIFQMLQLKFSVFSDRLTTPRSAEILQEFSWSNFREMLHFEKDFSTVINSLLTLATSDHGNGIVCQNFFENMRENDIDVLRSLTRMRSFNPASCLYFSKPAAHLCTIARKVIAKIYEISLRKAPKNTEHSDKNDAIKGFGSWIKAYEIFSGTSRQRLNHLLSYNVYSTSTNDRELLRIEKAVRYVVCIDKCSESVGASLGLLTLCQCHDYVDILLLPSNYEKLDIERNFVSKLKSSVQQLTSSPFHRVIFDDLFATANVICDEESSETEMLEATSSFSQICDKRRFLSRDAFQDSIEETENRFHENFSVKDVLNYFSYRSNADVLVLPKSSIRDAKCFNDKANFNEKWDHSVSSYTSEIYTACGPKKRRTITHIVLMSSTFMLKIHSPRRFLILVTSTDHSRAAYKFVMNLAKPGDNVVAVHVMIPTYQDLKFLKSLDDASLGPLEWSDLRRAKSLKDRIVGRSKRLKDDFSSIGCNLLSVESCDQLTLLQIYHKFKDNHKKSDYDQFVTEKLMKVVDEMEPTFISIGASTAEVDQIAIAGLSSLSQQESRFNFSSVSLEILKRCKQSFLIAGAADSGATKMSNTVV